MHWSARRLLETAREKKPVKRKGSKSSNFSSLICYTDQKEEPPQPTSISSTRPQLTTALTLTGDGSVCEEATVNSSTCANDSKPLSVGYTAWSEQV